MIETMKPSEVDWIGTIPFDWPIKKIRFTTTVRTEVGRYAPENVFIGLENVESSTGRLVETESEYEDGIYDVFRKGDVLFSRLRPYLEKAFIADFDGFCTGEFVIFKEFEGDKRFLFYFLLSHGFIEIVNASTYGAKMPRASWEYIKNLNMPLPCAAEQRAIATFLDDRCGQVDDIITDLTRQVGILRQYKKALITETVTKGLDKSAPMKDSGIDWIGEVPAHWEIKDIKHVGNVHSSRRIFEEEYVNEGIPFFRTKEIAELAENKEISLELFISESRYESLSAYHPKAGDLLISSIGTIGKVWVCDGRPFYYKDGNITQIDSNDKFNSYFLKYVIQSDLFFNAIVFYESTTTISALTIEKIQKVKICLPLIAEQNNIVEFLDNYCAQTDALIAEKERSIETMRQYKKSLIYEYVTGKKRVAN